MRYRASEWPWRSSAWSSSPTWASGRTLDKLVHSEDHLLSLVRSLSGLWRRQVLRIATAAQAGCGTGSRMMSGGRSSIVAPGGDATVAAGNVRPLRFTDTSGLSLSREASVYRLLKAHDLITSRQAFVRHQGSSMSSATRPRRRTSSWQMVTVTYSQGHRQGLVLPDRPSWTTSSRYIIAWKLCTNMTADDVIVQH